MTAALACMTCGAELRSSAKFCDECGSPVAVSGTPAEYKQVTVLFADAGFRAYRLGRGDAMTATRLVCSSCGIELPENAKFCLDCGAAVSTAAKPAEYKQVTVLFADLVIPLGDTSPTTGYHR